jgi:hypothetical protein
MSEERIAEQHFVVELGNNQWFLVFFEELLQLQAEFFLFFILRNIFKKDAVYVVNGEKFKTVVKVEEWRDAYFDTRNADQFANLLLECAERFHIVEAFEMQ